MRTEKVFFFKFPSPTTHTHQPNPKFCCHTVALVMKVHLHDAWTGVFGHPQLRFRCRSLLVHASESGRRMLLTCLRQVESEEEFHGTPLKVRGNALFQEIECNRNSCILLSARQQGKECALICLWQSNAIS